MRPLRSICAAVGLWLAVLNGAFAAEISAVWPPVLAPAGSAAVPLAFSGGGQAVAALQFDLECNPSAVRISAVLGPALRKARKGLYVATPEPGRMRFVVAGLNRGAVEDGPLVTVFLSTRADAPTGSHAVRFSNLVAADQDGATVALSAVSGTVSIQGQPGDSPQIQSEGVLNAASFLTGAVAPGEIVSIIGAEIGPPDPVSVQVAEGGAVPVSLANTRVTFDNFPAPLVYVSANYVSAIVPYGVAGRPATRMRIEHAGRTTNELVLPVAAAAPGVFTADQNGVGQAAVFNEGWTLNSPITPTARGSAAVLFATGEGQTDPPGVDGRIARDDLPKPRLAVRVRVGGVPADVEYVGAAPNAVAGLMQVNFRIRSDSPVGDEVPLELIVGDVVSQPGITIAVR